MTNKTITAENKTTPEQFAEEYLKAALSLGEGSIAVLKRQLTRIVESEAPITLDEAAKGFALIKRHTHQSRPNESGVYLKLFHGRTPFDMEMDDWGLDGPWIGPMKRIHFTYLSSFVITFMSDDEYSSGTVNSLPPSPLYLYEDCIYCDGIYYGDWEFQSIPHVLDD